MIVARKSNRAALRRRAELAKIHLAAKRLGLDDASYRAIVARVASGKTSSADLDQDERGALLDEFKRLGFAEGNTHRHSLDEFADGEPQHRLIRALWADCIERGLLRDGSERALNRFVRRTGGVDALRFCGPREANAVIEGLKAITNRAGYRGRERR